MKVAVGLGKHESVDHNKDEMFVGDGSDEVELKNIRINSFFQLYFIHFYALMKKRFIYFRNDLMGIVCQIVLPIIIIALGLTTTLIEILPSPNAGIFSPSILSPDTSNFWIAGAPDAFVTELQKANGISIIKKEASSLQGFDNLLRDNFDERRFYSAYVDQMSAATNQYEYALYFNASVPNAMLVGQNTMNNAILKLATGSDEASITTQTQPFPLTLQTSSIGGAVSGFFAIFFFTLAYAFIPSSNILFIVKEREENVKHQQLVSGVGLMAYWFSNFVIDYAKFLIVGVATLILILLYDIDTFIDGDHFTMSVALIFLFGAANIPFTYLTSFMFKSPSSA